MSRIANPTRIDPALGAALDAGALSLVLLIPTLVALWIDGRTLHDISVWIKPMKFQLSLTIHWLTIACLLPVLSAACRRSTATTGLLRIAALCSVIEVLYITLQAARGRQSHFNTDTPIESLMYYGVMGPAAVFIVLATAWLGWQMLRRPTPEASRGLAFGAGLGLLLAGLSTLIVTVPLASGAVGGAGHWVGGLRSDADGLPLVGWSRSGGDLRVPHFFATHLMQVLPLVGWCADRCRWIRPRRWVAVVAVAGLALIASTLHQALRGAPFIGIAGQHGKSVAAYGSPIEATAASVVPDLLPGAATAASRDGG
ncbi:MAG: hypothetical protein KIT73_05765 [Burkholderiales bacterium]|nr:hypothetical protein [Burkholderiales bacterium]